MMSLIGALSNSVEASTLLICFALRTILEKFPPGEKACSKYRKKALSFPLLGLMAAEIAFRIHLGMVKQVLFVNSIMFQVNVGFGRLYLQGH